MTRGNAPAARPTEEVGVFLYWPAPDDHATSESGEVRGLDAGQGGGRLLPACCRCRRRTFGACEQCNRPTRPECAIIEGSTGVYNPRWLAGCQLYLDRAIAFLGAGKPISEIGVPEVQGWLDHLRRQTTAPRCPMTNAILRWHLNALSNLYRRAQSEHLVPLGHNPVSALMEKSAPDPEEARWLEAREAALLLEEARVTPGLPRHAYPLLATLLLTGGRRAEVLGLEVADVSFNHHTVTFRKNASRRRLKTRTSQRTLPMWPQLEAILREYVFSPNQPPSRLLFPQRGAGTRCSLTFGSRFSALALSRAFPSPSWGLRCAATPTAAPG
jgi:integrase